MERINPGAVPYANQNTPVGTKEELKKKRNGEKNTIYTEIINDILHFSFFSFGPNIK